MTGIDAPTEIAGHATIEAASAMEVASGIAVADEM